MRPTSKPIGFEVGLISPKSRPNLAQISPKSRPDQGELARLNAVVDKVKDVVDDMTDASGDRDDKVRRNEKVAGVIPGVFTQVWMRAVEYKTIATSRTRVVFSRGSKSEV